MFQVLNNRLYFRWQSIPWCKFLGILRYLVTTKKWLDLWYLYSRLVWFKTILLFCNIIYIYVGISIIFWAELLLLLVIIVFYLVFLHAGFSQWVLAVFLTYPRLVQSTSIYGYNYYNLPELLYKIYIQNLCDKVIIISFDSTQFSVYGQIIMKYWSRM